MTCLWAAVRLPFGFILDRRKSSLFDRLPNGGILYLRTRSKPKTRLTFVQIKLKHFDAFNTLDRALQILRSAQSRHAVDLDDGIGRSRRLHRGCPTTCPTARATRSQAETG